ncbi:MAG: hypothetical protein ACRDFX_03190, partial [Chloroflexota bacterium]
IKAYLVRHDVKFWEESDLRAIAPEVDVVYQTRIQKERFDDPADYESARGIYIIDRELISRMKQASIVMHPLPRVNEIARDVDDDPRAAYFRQAQNGLFIRMALLAACLGRDLPPGVADRSRRPTEVPSASLTG